MNNIQEIIDKSEINQEIKLPHGEFEGTFYINKPITLIGNSTTLWSQNEPILIINSNNVVIKNIRIELTNESTEDKNNVCIKNNMNNTKFIDVEIIGNVEGVKDEDNSWKFPKIISLGDFRAEQTNSFNIEIEVPTKAELVCNIKNIKISPTVLNSGKNTIYIIVDKLKENTFLYGEILLKSIFCRRIYISGKAVRNLANYVDNSTIFKLSENKNLYSDIFVKYPNTIPPLENNESVILLKKGQRIAIKDITGYNIKVTLSYDRLLKQMDIDPYIFMLDNNNKAVYDNDLIFFGNIKSQCGSIVCNSESDNNLVNINLNTIPERIQRIAVTYSIYGDDYNQNFSKVINPVVRMFSKEKEQMRFYMEDLFIETTIVAVELYRYKNEWKMSAVGSGYKDGLKHLCESYGLTVI